MNDLRHRSLLWHLFLNGLLFLLLLLLLRLLILLTQLCKSILDLARELLIGFASQVSNELKCGGHGIGVGEDLLISSLHQRRNEAGELTNQVQGIKSLFNLNLHAKLGENASANGTQKRLRGS